jgi:hypothetical protein
MSDRIPARRPVTHAPLMLLITAAVLLATSAISLPSLLSLFLDGLPAALLLLACLGPGLRLMSLFRLDPLPLQWRLLGGLALGIGATTVLVLILGLLGFLGRGLWLALLALFTASAVLELFHLRRPTSDESDDAIENGGSEPHAGPVGRLRYLWILIVPFATMAVLAASTAPGFLWSEEGFGYDVLEYHLQLPREYFDAGRIRFTPHNVYGNFPATVEMLYLLVMILLDQTVDAGVACQFVHLLFGAAAVFAAWTVGRDHSPQCGLVCGVSAATLGWPVYLSGLAYVENGMLFFGIVAGGALLRAVAPNGSSLISTPDTQDPFARPRGDLKWTMFAGICAGLACGCKYTALPMIVLPLTLALITAAWIPFRWNPPESSAKPPRDALTARGNVAPATGILLFALFSLVSFSPWLAKNLAFTGNPVFPLANSLFRASPTGWADEEQQRWDAGHRPKPNEAGLSSRAALFWNHIPADKYQRFGPAIFLLAFAGLMARPNRRAAWMLGIVLLVQVSVWMAATHLYARFAVVTLIPLILLAGRSLSWSVPGAVTLLILGAGWNSFFLAKLFHAECPAGAPAQLIESGRVPAYEYYAAVNDGLDPQSKTLLVGESRAFYFKRPVQYAVVFNHSPFADLLAAASSADDLAAALQRDGFTHVFINWSELHRLARTYGLPASLSRESIERRLGNPLRVIREFTRPDGGPPWAVLCEVRRSGPS